MTCLGLIPKSDLLEFIAANPDCGVREIHAAFPDTAIKHLGQRLNRMAERGEIIRVFGSRGSRNYFPIVREHANCRTLHNPAYVREIRSVFDYL